MMASVFVSVLAPERPGGEHFTTMPHSLRQSRLLRELRTGTSQPIIKLNLIDPRIVELAGLSGASAVWLCNEHVPNDWLNLEHQVRAAKLYDMDTIIRVAKGSYSDYVKPFEMDATGIMVPHVTTADEARDIVRMTRFTPLGRRPMDGGNMDGLFCQVPTADYCKHSNAERFLIFQIESPEALENVEEIAAVPGFDILLFGPGDFSHLLGRPGEVNHPEVVAARKRVAAAAVKNGKFAMMPAMLDTRENLEAEGWRAFTVSADVIALGTTFNERVQSFKGAASSVGSTSTLYK
jgi:4-hydroxy-2-oxoheptanedioate aldolase